MNASLVLLELDSLHAINSKIGQNAGDAALVQFGQILARSFRESELVGRYAGNDFVVLLVNSDQNTIPEAPDRLDSQILQYNRLAGDHAGLVFNQGSASTDQCDCFDLQAMIVEADKALYLDRQGN